MKTGVSSYSFKNYTGGAATISEVIRVAKEIGFEQIEFVDFKFHNGDILDYAAEVKSLCADAGLTIAAYTCNADFLTGGGGDPSKEAERVKGCVDVAAALGANKMRHDATYGGNGELTYIQAVEMIAPYIREVAEYAESMGVKTMTENHGHFLQDSYRVEYLVARVNHPNYGVLIDVGNFICADEDPVQAVSRLAPLAFHVHAKDFKYRPYGGAQEDGWGKTRAGNYIVGTIAGQGDMPVLQCLKILKTAGYDGGLGLEFEGPEDNMTALVEGYKFLKRAIEELG